MSAWYLVWWFFAFPDEIHHGQGSYATEAECRYVGQQLQQIESQLDGTAIGFKCLQGESL
jgi:hypothetical protein